MTRSSSNVSTLEERKWSSEGASAVILICTEWSNHTPSRTSTRAPTSRRKTWRWEPRPSSMVSTSKSNESSPWLSNNGAWTGSVRSLLPKSSRSSCWRKQETSLSCRNNWRRSRPVTKRLYGNNKHSAKIPLNVVEKQWGHTLWKMMTITVGLCHA